MHAVATFSPSERDALIRSVFAPDAPRPELSSQHLVLIRHLRTMWMPIESGGPGVDAMQPLMGEVDTITAAMTALHTSDEGFAVRALAEVGRLIDVFMHAAVITPGRYPVPPEMRACFDFPGSGVDDAGHFGLRDAHVRVLKAAQWCEVNSDMIEAIVEEGDQECWPMPYIDGKHPYGGNGHYQMDIASALGEAPYEIDAADEVVGDPEKDARLEKLHIESLAALQVFLIHARVA